MPAFPEEIEAALQEGVRLETLVSPIGILSEAGRLTGIEFINNELGDVDASGRRRPIAVPGTQHIVPLNTLIVAISEGSDTDCVAVAGANQLDVDETRNTIKVESGDAADKPAGGLCRRGCRHRSEHGGGCHCGRETGGGDDRSLPAQRASRAA